MPRMKELGVTEDIARNDGHTSTQSELDEAFSLFHENDFICLASFKDLCYTTRANAYAAAFPKLLGMEGEWAQHVSLPTEKSITSVFPCSCNPQTKYTYPTLSCLTGGVNCSHIP